MAALEALSYGYLEPSADICGLRTFPCRVGFGDTGGENWSQTLGQIRLVHPLTFGPHETAPGGWTQDDVIVELSKKELKVTLGGVTVKELSGQLHQAVWRKDSWWCVQDGILIINLFKRIAAAWKGPFFAPGQFKRTAFPWTARMQEFPGYQWQNGDTFPMPPPADLAPEDELAVVDPGMPKPEEDEPASGGGYFRAIPGGPFAPMDPEGFICAAEDLVLGITAEQDSTMVTLEVHFERYAFENMKQRVPLEKLFAADVWPNEVCIFFQGDKRNPILWGALGGACAPQATTWSVGCSEYCRRRQSEPQAYSPCLTVVLQKAPHSQGKWDLVLQSSVQAKLMVKAWEDPSQRFEGLPSAVTARRAGFDLDSPDFWGNVDDYVRQTMKRTGHSSAPRKLELAE